jgi:DNA primase
LICYDGDTAGTAATLRGLDILDNQGCRAGAIRIPEGSDPDDYLRNNGKEMFLQLTEKAYSSFEYKFLLFTEQFNKEETSGKVAIIQAALPDLAKVKSPVARQGYITMMSDSLQFPESAIRDELRRYFGGYPRDGRTAFAKAPEAAPQGSEAIAQSTVMRSLLHDLNRQKDIEEAGGESLFIHLPAKELYQTLSALIRAGYRDFKEEGLWAIVDREEERHWLTGILLEDDPPGDQEKVYQDSLQTLKRQRLERQIKRVMSELTIAEKGGDASSAKEMMIALSGLAVEKQKLRSF